MTADPTVLERILDRLMRTLSAGGPDQLRAPFTVAEIVQALVPYRTYRNELGVDTLQDYEHAILEMLAGERGWLVCDPDTVAVIRKELASPDPDTGLLRRLQTVEVRVGAVRMPVTTNVRSPMARPEEDALDSEPELTGAAVLDTSSDVLATTETPEPAAARSVAPAAERTPAVDTAAERAGDAPPVKLSDAIAIGAVMDREDDEIARAGLSKPAEVPSPTPARSSAPPLPSLADLPSLVPVEPGAATTLHAMQGVTIANARTLSRITPLSVPSVYGDPIDFRGVRHAPVDVGGVIFLFGMIARELGFHVEAMTSGFPRCEAKRQLAPGKWARLRIDFELESRQFRDAGRNPGACDLVVCWRDTWPDRPASLDVLSLERVLPTLASRE